MSITSYSMLTISSNSITSVRSIMRQTASLSPVRNLNGIVTDRHKPALVICLSARRSFCATLIV